MRALFASLVVFFFVGIVASACGSDDPVECFYATTCLKTDCNGPIVRSGCGVVCGAGEIDQRMCFGGVDANFPDVNATDSAADAKADANADANSSDATADATDAKAEAASDANGE